jgi:hypothetical protein
MGRCKADNAPFLATGTAANKRLAMLLGVGGDSGTEGSGDLTRKFTTADLNNDPSIKPVSSSARIRAGMRSTQARLLGGMYDSGATLESLDSFRQFDYGSPRRTSLLIDSTRRTIPSSTGWLEFLELGR